MTPITKNVPLAEDATNVTNTNIIAPFDQRAYIAPLIVRLGRDHRIAGSDYTLGDLDDDLLEIEHMEQEEHAREWQETYNAVRPGGM